MQNPREHWEKVYQSKQPNAVSWFQEHATRSLELIHSVGTSLDANIIDVGGGASTLVDDLLGSSTSHEPVQEHHSRGLEAA